MSESNLKSSWIPHPIPDPSRRLEVHPAVRISDLEDARHTEDIRTMAEMGGLGDPEARYIANAATPTILCHFGSQNAGNTIFTFQIRDWKPLPEESNQPLRKDPQSLTLGHLPTDPIRSPFSEAQGQCARHLVCTTSHPLGLTSYSAHSCRHCPIKFLASSQSKCDG